MAKHIDPKPTRYKNIQFKSRLEARWAVFLDNASNVMRWEYEAITVSLPNGWTYTPDFRVLLYYYGHKHSFYMEVKPALPTTGYLEVLMSASRAFPKLPLMLIAGSFFYKDGEHQYTAMQAGKPAVVPPLDGLFSNISTARGIASGYRFDLRG